MEIPRELTPERAAELITPDGIGRLGLCTADGPHIVPVSYVVDGASVVFRTSAHGVVGNYDWNRGQAVFEVDQLDRKRRRGWSVVVRGHAHRVEDAEEVDRIAVVHDPMPWAGGMRRVYVRLPWSSITGRAVGDDLTEQTPRPPSVLEDIAGDECVALLESASLGRVAFVRSTGPVVIPVNYVWSEGRLIFRTSPNNSWVWVLRHGSAAFEVEDIDEVTHSGWTVLVQGQATHLDPKEVIDPAIQHLRPWAAGERPLHIAITPASITGRRLLPHR
ncbi:MAG TPA: pyridoxamine 5'-phosphate oxidase family protein [Nocardioidaceae bacterium]|nr:pyridoxamine 5'-phosphate oxidase family protein [Nocardioidaceae bacterium]